MQHVEREVEVPSPPAEVWQAVIDMLFETGELQSKHDVSEYLVS